jgi:hypothetical protein
MSEKQMQDWIKDQNRKRRENEAKRPGPFARFNRGYNVVKYRPVKKQPVDEQRKTIVWKLLRTRAAVAKRRGVPFDLVAADITVPDYCPITGTRFVGPDISGNWDDAPTLDRVNNRRGYVRGNVRVISRRGNRMKSDLSAEDCDRIAAYIRKYSE